jgi:acyl-[acyl-carrier-protein] desaturase
MRWVRNWTAEENRHGDLLNKYLYLSGRVNMRQMEISTQWLIADGFDIGTDQDPYRNFIYTSFQEMATNVSHRRVASLAKKDGDTLLSKMCGVIASDEARHAKAYKAFVSKIMEVDPNEAIIAFEDMMRKKIVMPAHFLREMGQTIGQTFAHFTDAAQRLGVYTSVDYVDILKDLIVEWRLESARDLNEQGEKARVYLMNLPDRLSRIAERMKNPTLEYKFSWIHAM